MQRLLTPAYFDTESVIMEGGKTAGPGATAHRRGGRSSNNRSAAGSYCAPGGVSSPAYGAVVSVPVSVPVSVAYSATGGSSCTRGCSCGSPTNFVAQEAQTTSSSCSERAGAEDWPGAAYGHGGFSHAGHAHSPGHSRGGESHKDGESKPRGTSCHGANCCGCGGAQFTLIANVPYDTVRQDLIAEFRRFGRVELAMVVCDEASRHPHKEWTSTAGYAFVRFSKRSEAAAAIQAAGMGLVLIRGVRVRADWAHKDSYAKRGRVSPLQGAPLLSPITGIPDGIQAIRTSLYGHVAIDDPSLPMQWTPTSFSHEKQLRNAPASHGDHSQRDAAPGHLGGCVNPGTSPRGTHVSRTASSGTRTPKGTPSNTRRLSPDRDPASCKQAAPTLVELVHDASKRPDTQELENIPLTHSENQTQSGQLGPETANTIKYSMVVNEHCTHSRITRTKEAEILKGIESEDLVSSSSASSNKCAAPFEDHREETSYHVRLPIPSTGDYESVYAEFTELICKGTNSSDACKYDVDGTADGTAAGRVRDHGDRSLSTVDSPSPSCPGCPAEVKGEESAAACLSGFDDMLSPCSRGLLAQALNDVALTTLCCDVSPATDLTSLHKGADATELLREAVIKCCNDEQ